MFFNDLLGGPVGGSDSLSDYSGGLEVEEEVLEVRDEILEVVPYTFLDGQTNSKYLEGNLGMIYKVFISSPPSHPGRPSPL